MIIDAHVTTGHIGGRVLDAAELIGVMDAVGVDRAVVSPDPREVAVAHAEGHARLMRDCAAHPGRLLAYCTANPWFGDAAVSHVRRAFDDGAVALKLHPALQGFQPIDHLVDPLIEVAAAVGAFVYVHSGTPAHATPVQVAVLAGRFPDVRFIVGRSGKTDFRTELPTVLRTTSNLIADTSHDFPRTGIKALLAAAGPERVVFASDHPFGELKHELAKVRATPATPDVLDRVLGGTLASMVEGPAPAIIDPATGE